MHNAAIEIKNLVDRTKEKINTFQNDIWLGEASEAYKDKAYKLLINLEKTYTELEYAILYIAKCSDSYSAIDKNTIEQIQTNLGLAEINLNGSSIFNIAE